MSVRLGCTRAQLPARLGSRGYQLLHRLGPRGRFHPQRAQDRDRKRLPPPCTVCEGRPLLAERRSAAHVLRTCPGPRVLPFHINLISFMKFLLSHGRPTPVSYTQPKFCLPSFSDSRYSQRDSTSPKELQARKGVWERRKGILAAEPGTVAVRPAPPRGAGGAARVRDRARCMGNAAAEAQAFSQGRSFPARVSPPHCSTRQLHFTGQIAVPAQEFHLSKAHKKHECWGPFLAEGPVPCRPDTGRPQLCPGQIASVAGFGPLFCLCNFSLFLSIY
ncbi:uncharacterized protein LOC143680130 [Tamandua tetradactyla]|uniref:uncharacterized protein LOC143680130 n=1 Tax=Tamandua tetradactyla TaxID=48850 RepID=UPI0040547376